MANLFNKIWSNLDIWDREENKRQNAEFARQDEEEKRRKQQEQATRSALQRTPNAPSVSATPSVSVPAYNPDEPLVKVGSQSDSRAETASKLERTLPTAIRTPLKSAMPVIKAAPFSIARVATGLVQGASGLYDWLSPGKGTNRVTQATNKVAEGIDRAAKDAGVEPVYKGLNVPLEVATYFTPGGVAKVASKVPQVASTLGKLTKASKVVGEVAEDSSKVNKFVRAGASDLISPENLMQEARLTGRYTGQDSARGERV